MMNNMRNFAMNAIMQNQQIANNPNAQEFVDVIRNNDAQRGQMIAKNLCDTYGITPEQAISQAKQFFNIP